MPTVTVKVERKTNTRSRTQEDKKNKPFSEVGHNVSPKKIRSQTQRPTGGKSEVRSTISRIKRGPVKFEDRKFFTVAEDADMLNFMKKNEGSMTSRSIAEHLSKRIFHSTESIRDRIKRFISKLRSKDEDYIREEAKVTILFPLFFAF